MAAKGKTAAKTQQPEDEMPKSNLTVEELLARLEIGDEAAAENAAQLSGGNRVPYIKCITNADDKCMDETEKEYIKGAEHKGFVVPDRKVYLGKTVDLTILGIFKLYEEKVKLPEGESGMAKIVGYWMPDQAQQVPIAEGSYFDREFLSKQGDIHVLSPVFWMMVLIKGQEHLGPHNIAFRSTASENAKLAQKAIENSKLSSPQLIFRMTAEKKEFKKFNKITYRPLLTLVDKKLNYEIKGKKIHPDAMDLETVKLTIEMYANINEEYKMNRLVAKRQIADVVAERAAIPEKTRPRF